MAIIDDKVVAMSFESSKFEASVNSTIAALDKLKDALKLTAASKGLENVASASKKIDLSHIGRGVDAIQQKLGYFSVASLAIFAKVAAGAVSAGAQIVKALSLDPVLDGFKEYETQINAIQVILSNTAVAGTTINDVTKSLDELNTYADKTIYNFGEMTRNIGTFTAAGVDLKTSVSSIKGLSNVAALSGASASDAARAMYQLSQAISAGKVQLMDWRSVENANMGSAAFKRALTETAVQMGTLKENAVKMIGPMKNVMINGQSFRQSLASKPGEDAWLTSGVLTQTLKQLSGDLSDAELAAKGYTKAEIKSIQALAQNALGAATEVKTLSQLISTTKEQMGTQWADTFKILFGNFNEAKELFTSISDAIGGFIQKNGEARNKVLQDWKDLGGRTVLIEAISTMFKNLGMILKPIKDAFRDIFPAKTGADLMYFTQLFERFVDKLRPSAETIANLKRTFLGVFAALDIGKQILVGVYNGFKSLFEAVGGGDGGFLSFTARIGDWVVALNEALKKGDRLNNFFKDLGNIIALPINAILDLSKAIKSFFSEGDSTGKLASNLGEMTDVTAPLSKALDTLTRAWDRFTSVIKDNVDTEGILESIGTAISGIGIAIGKAAASMNFEAILSLIRTGFFAALVLMFKDFLGKGSFLDQFSKGFAGGILNNISGVFANLNGIFSGLSGSAKAMQQQIKAKALREIALAIFLLAASLLMLSLVDPERLNSALGAMTIMFAELIGAMALLNKIAQTGGLVKLPIILAGLIALAIAIDLLTIAVLAMSRLSWNELIKGLAGIAGSLLIMVKSVEPLAASKGGLIRASVGISSMASALYFMAIAVKKFGSMSMMELGKGLGGVAASLAIMTKAMSKMPEKPVGVAGLIAMGIALNILALAVRQFASMNVVELAKGLGGVSIGLAAMVVAMRKMPPTMAASAAQLLAIAGAMWILSGAVAKMGGMSLSQIGKGLGTLAASLIILGTALKYMSANVKGAAALTITAVAMGLLAPALVMLGKQSLASIVKSLVALGGALVIMGAAGLALAPVVPALLGLGVAMALIGGGLALAGAGLLAIAAGISALAIAGPAGIGIMVAALKEFYSTIPELATQLVLGLLAVLEGLSRAAPEFVKAIVDIISMLVDAIVKSAPKMAEAFVALIDAAISVLTQRQDDVIAAGLAFLISFLRGIRDNIAEITMTVVDVVAAFLSSMAANIGKIIASGAQLLISFLKGIANNIAKVAVAAVTIILKFIGAIALGGVKIVTAGAGLIIKLVEGIANNIGKVVAAGADAIIKFVTGLGSNARRVVEAGVDAVLKFISGLGKNAVELAEGAAQVIVDLLNGLTKAINKYTPQIQEASKALGWAIINGMTWGLAGKAQDVYDKATEIANKVLGIFKKIPLINSPSKVTMEVGASLMEGLQKGMDSTATDPYSSAEAISKGLIGIFTSIFQTNSPSKVMIEIGKFVGQGFAQGLRGSKADINAAFKEMNELLTNTMKTARETIISEQKKLDELRKADKPDAEAIAKSQKIIDDNERLLARSIATRKALRVSLQDEKTKLIELTTQYEKIAEQIRGAEQALIDAKQARDDAEAGYTSQYSALPEIQTTDAEGNALTPEQQVQQYLEALRIQSEAVATYKTTLDQLRKLGLDDATYKKLLEEGTADQEFANALLAGGKTAIEGLNTLDKQLMTVSKSLGTSAAKNLYQAGVDSAAGYLKGLKSKNAKIKKAMEDLVDEIIDAIKARLGIKSPSRVFEEIGSYAMQGLANGIYKYKKYVNNAIETLGDETINKMSNTLSRLQDIIPMHIDTTPRITPILDLSDIHAKSGEIAALTRDIMALDAMVSYEEANRIASAQAQLSAHDERLNRDAIAHSVKFEQYNYSPKALTEVEIYRQTRNQISQINSLLVAHT